MRWTAEDFAQITGAFRREMAGAVRRMVVKLSNTGTWQLLGHALLDPSKREAMQVENYPGIGVLGRPPLDSGNAEGVVINVGGVNNPALIATRDESTRVKVDDLAPDESALYNSLARVYVKADGTIELRTHSGVAIRLPTLADVAKIGTAIAGAAPVAMDGGVALKTTILAGLASSLHGAGGVDVWPVGTTKLKAE